MDIRAENVPEVANAPLLERDEVPADEAEADETAATDVVIAPPVSHRKPPEVTLSRRKAAGVLIGTVVVTAGITFVAMQPTLSGLNRDLNEANAQNDQLTSKAASLQTVRDACHKAASASSASLEHWTRYMDDVQNMLLASSSGAVDKVMPDLQKSYRFVVQDKVPTGDALAECLASP
jgi:biotin-(acetyl-CoA carboxylase) ligase